jgi:uncharacterized membrane protein
MTTAVAPDQVSGPDRTAVRNRLAAVVRAWPWAVAAVFFVLYLALSLKRQRYLQSTGYDLGIFEQVVRAYAHFSAPVVPLKGPGYNILGDHFSPILATLAPFYRLFPSPVTLLAAQALLLAVSIIPIAQLARERLSEWLAAAATVSYALAWGLQQALGFDFHEIAFAVPLMAFTVKALAQERWRAAIWWSLPLILVKEDLGATVAAVGVYIFLIGHRRRLGALVAAGGAAVFLLVSFVLIPSFNNHHTYAYSSYLPQSLGDLTHGWDLKSHTLLLLAIPTVVIGLRSPLLILALPTLGWRFVSTVQADWDSRFHYDAILMPIVLAAFITQVGRVRDVRVRRALVAVGLVFAVGYSFSLPLSTLAHTQGWPSATDASAVRTVLDKIPDGAAVTASNRLVPQLTNRCTVYLFPAYPDAEITTPWVVTIDQDISPLPYDLIPAKIAQLPAMGYRVVATGPGVVLYHRG